MTKTLLSHLKNYTKKDIKFYHFFIYFEKKHIPKKKKIKIGLLAYLAFFLFYFYFLTSSTKNPSWNP